MSGIPVTIHLEANTFKRLEAIAQRKNVTMRSLIAAHLAAALDPEPYSRVVTSAGEPVRHQDVDAWIEAARMGVTNRTIASRWGVSEQLVSRCLNSRGIYRQKRRGDEE